MKTNTRAMFGNGVAKKSRAGKKRLSFQDKMLFVLGMIERNLDYHQAISGHRGFGFTMGQIASMTRYAPSSALMNDLFKMVEEGMLKVDTRAAKRTGLSPVEHIFYTPKAWLAKAHGSKRML